jgi:hypothetical protein
VANVRWVQGCQNWDPNKDHFDNVGPSSKYEVQIMFK